MFCKLDMYLFDIDLKWDLILKKKVKRWLISMEEMNDNY